MHASAPRTEGTTIEAHRWRMTKAILERALNLPLDLQAGYVEEECNGDRALHHHLVLLLEAAHATGGVVDRIPLQELLHQDSTTHDPALIGRRVGAFKILRLVGFGGMGTVYEAVRDDGQYEQRVAIKFVRDGFSRLDLAERLEAERRILATLDHPNISRLIDAGLLDGHGPYFVMEYVDGEPIDAYCERQLLSTRERVMLMRTVCAAADYAHQQGVVHRDLKPRNILVTQAGVPKLLDFGIAKRLGGDLSGDGGTLTLVRALTPEYASPEQLRGEPAGRPSDIYGLGLVLYKVLTGSSPYEDLTSPAALQEAICDRDPVVPSMSLAEDALVRRSELRGDLDAVVMMALRKQPHLRYRSAQDMADDLFRYVEGLAVTARAGSLSYRLMRSVSRRQKVAFGAIVSVNVILMLSVCTVGWLAIKANHERARAERNAQEVRSIADTLISGVGDKLSEVPGTVDARRFVVQRSMEYLERLSNGRVPDAALRIELAGGYLSIGDALGRAFHSNLGDSQGALAQYQKGIQVIEQGSTSRTMTEKRLLASLYSRSGDLAFSLGDGKGALRWANAQIDLGNQILLQAEATSSDKSILAGAHVDRARAEWLTESKSLFVKDVEEAIKLYQEALASGYADRKTALALAAAYQNLAWYRIEADRSPSGLEAALVLQSKARDILKKAIVSNPGRSAKEDDAVAMGFVMDAEALMALKRPKEALAPLAQAVSFWRGRISIDSKDIGSRVHLAEPLSGLASAYLELREWDPGIASAREAISICGALPTSTGPSLACKATSGSSLDTLGRLLESRSEGERVSEAISDLRASLAAFKEALAVARDPRIHPMLRERDPDDFNESNVLGSIERVNGKALQRERETISH